MGKLISLVKRHADITVLAIVSIGCFITAIALSLASFVWVMFPYEVEVFTALGSLFAVALIVILLKRIRRIRSKDGGDIPRKRDVNRVTYISIGIIGLLMIISDYVLFKSWSLLSTVGLFIFAVSAVLTTLRVISNHKKS